MASSAKTNNKPGSAERPVPHTRIENETMFEEKYEFGRKLGQGSFGVVYEVKNKATAKRWACKAIYKEKVWAAPVMYYMYIVGKGLFKSRQAAKTTPYYSHFASCSGVSIMHI